MEKHLEGKLVVVVDGAKNEISFSEIVFVAYEQTLCLKYGHRDMGITLCADGDHAPIRLSQWVQKLLEDAESVQMPPCGI